MNILKKLLIIIPAALFIGAVQVQAIQAVASHTVAAVVSKQDVSQRTLLGDANMSLANRYPVPAISDVFSDNILLNLAYMSGKVKNAKDINWDEVRHPESYEFTLQPGEVFAYHDGVMPRFADKTVITTKAHFNAAEGFRSSGLLFGDGVCHFASLINWASRNAGLGVTAPVNHSFANIPGVAPEYGTSIYYSAGQQSVNEQQNLYVENTLDKPVTFVFTRVGDDLKVAVYENK